MHILMCMEMTNASQVTNTAHDTTIITGREAGVTETLRTPIDRPGSRAFTREQRHAYRQVPGKGTASIELTVNMSDDGESFYVRWSSNRGRAWGKSYRKTCANEAAAKLFAAAKWEVMITWLVNVEPVAAAPIDIMRL